MAFPGGMGQLAAAMNDPTILSNLRKPASTPSGGSGNARAKWLLLLVALIAVAASAGYWYATRDHVTTDDAYTDGRAVMIAPRVAGLTVALAVTDNQRVRAGDVLLRLDPSPFQAAVDQARASLAGTQAQLANARVSLETVRLTAPARLDMARAQLAAARASQIRAQADAGRQRALPRQATTKQEVDSAEAALRAADAQVAQADAGVREADTVSQSIALADAQARQIEAQVAVARAQLDQAALNLAWTTVTAPQDGWVTKRAVEVGSYVTAGQALMSLVTPEVWVTANFKEDQLDRMRLGQKVDLTVDAYPDLRLQGHIDSVQFGSGQRFSVFPAENATGNFVKTVQRVPVKILLDSGMDPDRPLPLGLSVVPTVHLK
jgi:membrane fusion protein (multidrug efflux system)